MSPPHEMQLIILGLSQRTPPRSPSLPHYAAAAALCYSPLTIPLLDPAYRQMRRRPDSLLLGTGETRARKDPSRPPGGRCEREWGLDGEARRRTRPAGGARAGRISPRRMIGGGEAWSTSRWLPPRPSSAAGVHGELLSVTTSPSACCRPPPRPGATVTSSSRLQVVRLCR
jgi:hypothetical protein